MGNDSFDPKNIRQHDMNKLAEAIEEYIHVLEDIMVIPKDLKKECGKDIEEGLRISKKLIKKLRKGDRDVFKSEDEWNPL